MVNVKLVAVTMPQIEGINNVEEFVAYCARVSNPSNQMNSETAHKLIRYCVKNKHWSIFEMVNVVLEISSTRDIIRQILRHRSFSFQEFSQRYADPTKDLGFVAREARLQDTKNRQNSIELEVGNDDQRRLAYQWEILQKEIIAKTQEVYKWAIEKGIAKEQARVVLPEGMTESKIYMNGTLRSFFHYIELRTQPGTQKEHREIAYQCANVIEPVFPLVKDFVYV